MGTHQYNELEPLECKLVGPIIGGNDGLNYVKVACDRICGTNASLTGLRMLYQAHCLAIRIFSDIKGRAIRGSLKTCRIFRKMKVWKCRLLPLQQATHTEQKEERY